MDLEPRSQPPVSPEEEVLYGEVLNENEDERIFDDPNAIDAEEVLDGEAVDESATGPEIDDPTMADAELATFKSPGRKIQFTPREYPELDNKPRIRLAEIHQTPQGIVDWEDQTHTKTPANNPSGLYREAMIKTAGNATFYIRNDTLYKFTVDPTTGNPLGRLDSVTRYDHNSNPIPSVVIGEKWHKEGEAPLSEDAVENVVISLNRVTGDPKTREINPENPNVPLYKRSGEDIFAHAYDALAEAGHTDLPVPVSPTPRPVTAPSPERIRRNFHEVSGSSKGSEPKDFLKEKSVTLVDEFMDKLSRLSRAEREQVLGSCEKFQLKNHRLGKPAWTSPRQLQNRQGLPNKVLLKSVWEGRGIRIGSAVVPNSSNTIPVILCPDDGKLRCFRDPSALPESYGEGYGEMPEGAEIRIDTNIREANLPQSAQLKKILDKYA